MTERLWDVPSSWEWTVIKDLGDVVSGGTPSTRIPEYWGGNVIWFAPSDLTGYRSKFIDRGAKTLTDEGLAKSSAKVMPAGSVMFSSRAPVGYVAINSKPSATNQGFKSIVPHPELFNQYLYYYLKAAKHIAQTRATGTTFKELSGSAFAALPIPIAPTNEQRRIVGRIEALFDEIDRGIESLRAAKSTIALYRQSLLKSAFEGRLTADWRAQNSDKLERPDALLARAEYERNEWHRIAFEKWTQKVEAWQSAGAEGPKPRRPEGNLPTAALAPEERAVLPRIPQEWMFLRLSDIAAVGSGMSVSKARKPEAPVDVPYLRVANVQRGFLDLDEIKTMQIERSQAASLTLRRWDVLFNEGGDRDKLGRGWVWECQIPHCITQNHVFRASPFRHDLDWSKYISQWGNSFGRDYFERSGKQTTNLASINKTVLKALPIPYCSVSEQAEIVRILDARLQSADVLDAEIDVSLTRAEALRQSILKKAFTGDLVSQDPTDEPAAALLTQVRAERAEGLARRRTKPEGVEA